MFLSVFSSGKISAINSSNISFSFLIFSSGSLGIFQTIILFCLLHCFSNFLSSWLLSYILGSSFRFLVCKFCFQFLYLWSLGLILQIAISYLFLFRYCPPLAPALCCCCYILFIITSLSSPSYLSVKSLKIILLSCELLTKRVKCYKIFKEVYLESNKLFLKEVYLEPKKKKPK